MDQYHRFSDNSFLVELDHTFYSPNAIKAESMSGITLVLRKVYPAIKNIGGVYCSYELQTMDKKRNSEYTPIISYNPDKTLFEQYTKMLEGVTKTQPKEVTCTIVDDVSPAEAENNSTLIPPLGSKIYDGTGTTNSLIR